jgi:phosphotransferase system  glucose/maltose/N-acetylglucosamine-specific IIC component
VGLVALIITVLRARSALVGSINLRWQPKAMAYTIFYAVLIGFVLIIASGWRPGLGSIYLLVVWVFVLVLTVTKVIAVQIQQSELATKEKLLEIELKLAEISGQMAKKRAE